MRRVSALKATAVICNYLRFCYLMHSDPPSYSIHEQHQARRRSTSESEPQPPDVDGSSPSRRRRAAKQIQMIKAEDADKRSNFYPITWRVIGGGVMMSGHRRCSCILHLRHSVTHRFLLGEACNDFLRGECALGSDCKFAHPVEDDDDFSDASSYADLPEPYSPVSPLCLSPYYPYQPIPIFATAVNELVAPEPVKIIEPPRNVFAPVILDGNTLLPRTEPVTSEYDEQKVPVEADTNLPAAREIPRPVSTPPVPNGSSVSDMKSLRVSTSGSPRPPCTNLRAAVVPSRNALRSLSLILLRKSPSQTI